MEIDYNDYNKLINGQIIDLRDDYKYQKSHLDGAINLSFYKLVIEPEKYLHKNINYLLVCEYGIKSKKISEILNNNGYKTYSLKGGYKR